MNLPPLTFELRSAIVPVTGAASGIGLAICRRLRAEGATPLLMDLDKDRLHAAANDVYAGDKDAARHAYVLDVSDARAVEQAFEAVQRDHGAATHAVASAGIVGAGSILDITDEQWQRVLGVNQHGVMYFCRAAARQMVQAGRKGAIVNIASVAGLAAKPNRLAYTTSKAAVVNMTRSLAIDLGPHGIRVNAIAPGVIETPMQGNKPVEVLKARAGSVPLARLGQADDVARVALFLLSDLAGYVSGHTMVVDGAMTAEYRG